MLLYTYSEKNKEPLILFAHTVIDPGAVVVHLPDTSFTNTAAQKDKMLLHDKLTVNVSTAAVSTGACHNFIWSLKSARGVN